MEKSRSCGKTRTRLKLAPFLFLVCHLNMFNFSPFGSQDTKLFGKKAVSTLLGAVKPTVASRY